MNVLPGALYRIKGDATLANDGWVWNRAIGRAESIANSRRGITHEQMDAQIMVMCVFFHYKWLVAKLLPLYLYIDVRFGCC